VVFRAVSDAEESVRRWVCLFVAWPWLLSLPKQKGCTARGGRPAGGCSAEQDVLGLGAFALSG
jgi:hypothetical protein